MVNTTRERWNKIYRNRTSAPAPAAILTENHWLLRSSRHRTALDIACGTGINALYLASLGYSVEAWDISDVAIGQLTSSIADTDVNAICCDITPASFTNRQFDLILNCHFLDRSLFPGMLGAVRPGGLMCFQTFTNDKKLDIGPANTDYLLRPGELESWLAETEILAARNAGSSLDEQDPLAGREYVIARVSADPGAC